MPPQRQMKGLCARPQCGQPDKQHVTPHPQAAGKARQPSQRLRAAGRNINQQDLAGGRIQDINLLIQYPNRVRFDQSGDHDGVRLHVDEDPTIDRPVRYPCRVSDVANAVA